MTKDQTETKKTSPDTLTPKIGRPSTFTEEIATEICNRMAQGQSVRAICLDDDMPAQSTVYKWLTENDAFSEQYALARAEQAHHMGEEILEIADDGTNDWIEKENKDGSTYMALNHEHVQRSKLRVDSRKWLMSKLLPKKYGEASHLKISNPDGGPVEVSAMTEAERKQEIADLQAQLSNKGEQ
jgi:hypothetical protein